jgi:multicomponent Na+:H+ antiporter subunit G
VSAADWATAALAAAGVFFFLAGSIGLLRFPDVFSRLHALTKADNLGLGCVLAGLAFQAGDLATVGRLALLWALVLAASTLASFLVADAARRAQEEARDAG